MVNAVTGPRVVLIGPPGAGKSTIGRRLGKALDLSWHDTDRAVEESAGQSIADLFVDHGEAHFRDLERAEVLRSLSQETGVVSVGGGAPMDPEVQAALTGRTVVFLDVGIADAARRIGFDASRPLLTVNPRASWTRMMNERRPTYQRLATLTVDTAGRKPAAVVEEIVGLLGAVTAGGQA
ncbi:shikimate kinase [Phycicoccus badiiscoriae]|uniref:Shikimate kinase n=1 Tax=Pedococcus badiiscoriae TaxID=642776 RepID=A0A852WKY2_9MICO|nr:shikimate kinase [Pedococcus badiiscoriae]